MYPSCRVLQSIKIQQCRTRSTVARIAFTLCPEQFGGLTPLLSAVASSAVDMTQHMQTVPPLAWSARLIASADLLQRRKGTGPIARPDIHPVFHGWCKCQCRRDWTKLTRKCRSMPYAWSRIVVGPSTQDSDGVTSGWIVHLHLSTLYCANA